MGFFTLLTEPLRNLLNTESTAVFFGAAFLSFLVVAIVGNVLHQLLVKSPAEPPIVFHWMPFIGSTITYGIDPYKFFFSCREKVPNLGASDHIERILIRHTVRRRLYIHSTWKEDHRLFRRQRK